MPYRRKEVVYLCGAKTRPGAGHATCHRTVLEKGLRCPLHGGKNLKGPAHPRWKDGTHSKYTLPVRLRPAYAEFLKNPDWINLADEIALARAELQALLNDVSADRGDPEWRDELRIHLESLRRMVETEVRRVKAEQMAIPVEQAVFFAQRVTDIAIEAIRFMAKGGDERNAISMLSGGIAQLTTGAGSERAN